MPVPVLLITGPVGVGKTTTALEVEARVYYDIDQAARIVRILRVGRKIRNRVFIRGIETDMREARE